MCSHVGPKSQPALNFPAINFCMNSDEMFFFFFFLFIANEIIKIYILFFVLALTCQQFFLPRSQGLVAITASSE